MKQLVCEMCGSTNIMKQDGSFVCQECGVRYSVEEARKLMDAAPAEGSGTARPSKELENCRRMGDDAYERGDYREAFDYYKRVVEMDETDYERRFKKNISYASSITMNQSSRVTSPIKALPDYLNCVHNDSTLSQSDKEVSVVWAVREVAGIVVSIFNLAVDIYIDDDGKTIDSSYSDLLDACEETFDRQLVLMEIIAEWIDRYPELRAGWEATCENAFVELNTFCRRYHDSVYATQVHYLSEVGAQMCYDYAEKFGAYRKRFEPNFVIPSYMISKEKGGEGTPNLDNMEARESVDAIRSAAGCYVATAVYGSYDCPQVWTLRRFRDDTLAQSWYGRAFIRLYYAVSPTLVKWFGHTEWFRNMWRGKLDRMVAKLQASGVEDTPYEDKNW